MTKFRSRDPIRPLTQEDGTYLTFRTRSGTLRELKIHQVLLGWHGRPLPRGRCLKKMIRSLKKVGPVKEITTEEAVKKLNGRGVFINVLDRAWLQSDLNYKLIDGSLHIALQELQEVQTIIPNKDQEIITYCAGPKCDTSKKAAKKLVEMGYNNVKRYKGGLRKMEEQHPDLIVHGDI